MRNTYLILVCSLNVSCVVCGFGGGIVCCLRKRIGKKTPTIKMKMKMRNGKLLSVELLILKFF